MDANWREGCGGRHLPTLKSKVPPLMVERTSIASNMTGGLISSVVQFWMWNMGSVSGNGGEVCE